jgi:rubrerythrin
MPTFTPTKDSGAAAQPAEVRYVDPAARVTTAALEAIMPNESINSVFVADLLSGMLAHERCGVHLYRSVAGRSNNPMLKGRYEEFCRETEHHVDVLERLVARVGGNPNYVSAQARAVEAMDSKLVDATYLGSGALDPMTAEMAMLDAVFLAETMCHTNWELLSKLSESIADDTTRSTFREAIDEVEEQEDQHLEWAKSTKARMIQMQAQSSLGTTVGLKAEEVVARVKSWFSD